LNNRFSFLAVFPHSGHVSVGVPDMSYQHFGQRLRPRDRSAMSAHTPRAIDAMAASAELDHHTASPGGTLNPEVESAANSKLGASAVNTITPASSTPTLTDRLRDTPCCRRRRKITPK
jgi:hypothetical protein